MSYATICDNCGKKSGLGMGRLGWFSVERHTAFWHSRDLCSPKCLEAWAHERVEREAASA